MTTAAVIMVHVLMCSNINITGKNALMSKIKNLALRAESRQCAPSGGAFINHNLRTSSLILKKLKQKNKHERFFFEYFFVSLILGDAK